MGRRAVLILSASLILALTVIMYFTGKGREGLLTDPYSAVGNRACIVVETVDLLSFLNSVTTGKGVFGEFGRVGELAQFNNRLKYLADFLNKAEIRDVSASHAVISIYSGKRPGILLSMAVSRDVKSRHIKNLLTSAGITNIAESKAGNSPLLSIPYSGNNDTLFLSIRSGLLLAGNSENLIESGITSIESKNDIRKAAGISRVLMAAGNDDNKVFLVFDNLPGLLKPLFSDELKTDGSALAKLASAGGGGLYVDDEGLILSGYTDSSDPSQLIHRYKSVRPAEFSTYRILPAGTALFETILRPDVKAITKKDTASIITVLAGGINEYLDDEITRAVISINEGDVSDNSVIIFEMKNPVQAEQVFSANMPGESGISWFQPDDQIKIPVYRLPSCGLSKALYADFSENHSDSLVAFYDRYMIAGSSFNTISRILYDNLLNNTLANDVVYRDFERSLPSRSGYYFYCVPSKILSYLEVFLSEKFISSLRKNRSSLNKIQAAGFQLASSNEMIYSSLSLRFKDQVRQESSSEWETLLDTTAAIKPFFFTNHITGAREIFVQDLKNNIYLINTAGRVLWKAPLSERIQGSIYMIDLYRNGKFQMLFNGKHYLHLIDRNGNYVERFPVKLRSPATNSLALFDYDNNRNYRILVAGEDRQVYAYDKTGNVVKGWKPFRTAGLVRNQISYFRVSGKDYLALSDETSLYLLDRSGNRRVIFKEPVTKAAGSTLTLNSGTEQFLICSSADGSIQHIYFDGTVKKFTVGNFSASHLMDLFDFDADGLDEFVFIDQGKIFLYDHNMTELSSSDLGSTKLEGPLTFSFSPEDRKIGVFDAEKNLIYLLDKNGEIMDGFPLKGASMFSIGKLSDKNSWNLIVGGPDKFLYNYIIGNGT